MTEIIDLPVSKIIAGSNDRKTFDQRKLAELAASIRENGLAQPITVRPLGDGFQIVAGERRFRAISQILAWDSIPAIVRELSDEDASAIMLVENTGREDLNPIEEATAYRVRRDLFGWTLDRIAETAGVSTELVRRRLALLDLAPDIQQLVATGNLPIGHAETMTKLDSNRQRIALRIMQEGGNPSLSTFRGIVNRLYEEQAQDSLIDLSTFYIEQLQAQAEMPRRGKAAVTGAPTRNDLPAVDFGAKDSTASVIDRWIAKLLEAGRTEEAAVAGTLYTSLVKGNFLQVPVSASLMAA